MVADLDLIQRRHVDDQPAGNLRLPERRVGLPPRRRRNTELGL